MGVARIFGPHVRLLCKMHEILVSYFSGKSLKLLPPDCLDFSSKHPKMHLAAGLRPDPLGELKRSPIPTSRKRGPTSKGREGREGWDGREGRRGRERRDFAGPIKIWLLRPCLRFHSSAIRRHHPPRRAVLSQICCFGTDGERKVVLFQILLDGAEPRDAGSGTTWLSSPSVRRRGG